MVPSPITGIILFKMADVKVEQKESLKYFDISLKPKFDGIVLIFLLVIAFLAHRLYQIENEFYKSTLFYFGIFIGNRIVYMLLIVHRIQELQFKYGKLYYMPKKKPVKVKFNIRDLLEEKNEAVKIEEQDDLQKQNKEWSKSYGKIQKLGRS